MNLFGRIIPRMSPYSSTVTNVGTPTNSPVLASKVAPPLAVYGHSDPARARAAADAVGAVLWG